MVEGPGVHRVAIAHRRVLLAKAYSATSPSGRFADGASAVDGRFLSLIEAHGKNIFYFFTKQKLKKATVDSLPEDVVVVHIHFGMSGSFRTYPFPGPEPREKTRLKLENEKENSVSHLSAQLCVHGGLDLYRRRAEELGPDPLRTDADKERVWLKMQKTKKTIGGIIMDQTFIAGIGNIYRTEILFVIGMHPNQPAASLSRSNFEDLWSTSVRLLEVGVKVGSITTVSQEEAGKPYSKLKAEDRRYVYSHSNCRRCGGPVLKWTLAARSVYACEHCQPLQGVKVTDEKVVKIQTKARRKAAPSDEKPVQEAKVTAKKSSSKKVAKAPPTSNDRKRKVRDGRIVEHQALKDIPCGGLFDGPFDLDDALWSSATHKEKEKKVMENVVKNGKVKKYKVKKDTVKKDTVKKGMAKKGKTAVLPELPFIPVLIDLTDVALESKSLTGRRSSRSTKKVQRLGIDVIEL